MCTPLNAAGKYHDLNEVFLEVYNLFVQVWEEGTDQPKEQQIKDAFYWYVSDYSDLLLPWRIREGLDPKLSFAKDIIMESDLNDLSYLYEFGEYISESELKLAAFMNTLPQETVDKCRYLYRRLPQRLFCYGKRHYQKEDGGCRISAWL